MANDNGRNLITFDQRSETEQREMRKRGGVKSGETRRAKKEEKKRNEAFCEILAKIMLQPLKQEQAKEALKEVGIDNPTMKDGIMYRLSSLALKGDLKALEMAIKLTGDEKDREKLTGQKIDVTTNGKDINNEPIRVEVIDKREQVDKKE